MKRDLLVPNDFNEMNSDHKKMFADYYKKYGMNETVILMAGGNGPSSLKIRNEYKNTILKCIDAMEAIW